MVTSFICDTNPHWTDVPEVPSAHLPSLVPGSLNVVRRLGALRGRVRLKLRNDLGQSRYKVVREVVPRPLYIHRMAVRTRIYGYGRKGGAWNKLVEMALTPSRVIVRVVRHRTDVIPIGRGAGVCVRHLRIGRKVPSSGIPEPSGVIRGFGTDVTGWLGYISWSRLMD